MNNKVYATFEIGDSYKQYSFDIQNHEMTEIQSQTNWFYKYDKYFPLENGQGTVRVRSDQNSTLTLALLSRDGSKHDLRIGTHESVFRHGFENLVLNNQFFAFSPKVAYGVHYLDHTGNLRQLSVPFNFNSVYLTERDDKFHFESDSNGGGAYMIVTPSETRPDVYSVYSFYKKLKSLEVDAD